MHSRPLIIASAAALAVAAGGSLAAPPDWSKVPVKTITAIYPGVSPMEWIMKGTEHGGVRGIKRGETCASCHDDEAADMSVKMVTGQKIEPNPQKGKPPSIAVAVQAAHDGTNLYLRFSWKQPAGGGRKMDPENPVKLAFMLDDNKVEFADLSGCWASCHQDSRTMPGAKDDRKTKYVKDGSLATGKFYDLLQWKSHGKPADGYVADRRVMEGGKGLVSVEAKNDAGIWSVTFVRLLAGGGEGDIVLAPGKTYNFGFAIHDDYSDGRYHHVSLGHTLGIDKKGDVTAAKP